MTIHCAKHNLPKMVCITTGPCAKERRATRAQERLARAMEGNQARTDGAKGGRPPKKLTPEQARAEVAQLQRDGKAHNVTEARRKVARKYGVSESTVRQREKA